MKTVFLSLMLMTLIIGLSSGFVAKPYMAAAGSKSDFAYSESPLGGAFLVYAGKNGGDIKKSEMRGQTELAVEGCAKGSRIFAFSIEINHDGKVKTLQAQSNLLSKEMVAALDGLTAGDTFEFKSTKAYLPNGKDVVDVHGQKFVVVQG